MINMDDDALFYEALRENSIAKMKQVAKSDLHNHAGRGGNMKYLSAQAGCSITPARKPFASLSEMQEWFEQNVKVHFPGLDGYLKRVEASFVQAAEDHIQVLSLSYSMSEANQMGGIEPFIRVMQELHRKNSPDTDFYPELVLGQAEDIELELSRLERIFSYQWFQSVDWQEEVNSESIKAIRPLFRKAKQHGLKLRAHVGEFTGAGEVRACVEELELDEVHHGLAAVTSKELMRFLADHKIQLNLCPTSNIMLGRVRSYETHPIRQLYDQGIKVTINTDDLLIFNATASDEYLHLYQSGLMSEQELNEIRKTGLQSYQNI